MTFKPEPGKPAMTRDGRMVDDLKDTGHALYPLSSLKYGLTWRADGGYDHKRRIHPHDLVEPPAPYDPKDLPGRLNAMADLYAIGNTPANTNGGVEANLRVAAEFIAQQTAPKPVDPRWFQAALQATEQAIHTKSIHSVEAAAAYAAAYADALMAEVEKREGM